MQLREIVNSFIDSKDSSSHEFRRLYNIGAFGMRTEFNLDIKGNIKTVVIPVNANKTALLPTNYISYCKIGLANPKGEIATLKRNDKLVNYHADFFNVANRNDTLPTLPSYGFLGGLNNGLGIYDAANYLNFNYGGTSYNLFGLGSGTPTIGEYKVDDANRIILFDPNFIFSEIILEYLSDGCDEENDDYEVDIRAAETVKCYLRWQNAIDMPKKYPQGVVREFRSQYYNEKRKSRMRINPVVLNEMSNAERRSWKLVAKA